ncbi:uncharacterized protein DUF4129 [Ornithinimicrobium humiphilum]|uniref:Uncharacterized protein DUF4129 n=1 Tax=Ornithinimicrobium humiphilum TaxID=125288 RepID=A0A543KM27_9MICO|nr:DUF4129 domain-containing protein [Ornithinimicrobium humiphilum]TQM96139.1 uncharacterized protein DUF4129 [Ornithinimicrobium humiphilum]
MRRGTRSTVVVAVVTTAVLLVLLLWSAGNGTPLVSAPEGSFGDPRAETPTASVTLEPQDEPPPQEEGGDERVTQWSFNLALVLWLMALVATLLMVLRWLSRQRLESQERREVAEEEELVALLEATSDEVRYQALSEGDPRNAVVACWVALEEAVRRSGLPPERSETAVELTSRVLGRWQVDEDAIRTLCDAYREARFSRHPVTEEQRTLAVDALERIHLDLRRRAREQEEAGAGGAQTGEAHGIPGTSAEDPSRTERR